MSLQQLLESGPSAGSRVVGGGRVDVFGQAGNWLRNNVFRTFDPVQEAARFRARQNTVPTQPRGRVSNLPPSARVPSQYPAGVPTGIGGGNAGASRAPAPVAQTQAPAPASQPQSSNWAPAAQQNPRLPAGRNVAIVNPRSQAQNRALDQAAQNAGLPAWNWKAAENKAVFDAAEARSQAATAAREAQGGRGYITADNLPAALDQSKAEYWQGADTQAWAAANPELAQRAMARAGYRPQAAPPSGEVGGIGPIADGQAYGRQLQDLQGTQGVGPVASGDTYSQMLNMPQQQAPIPSVQGVGPVADGDAYGAQLEAMQGTSGMGPLADPQTYGAMLTGADEQRRRAAALSNSYVRAIQQHGMGLG
jgi:hypothetical protein